MTPDEIARRFDYHPPTTDAKHDAHQTVRDACRTVAEQIDAQCPDGREKSLAVARIEEAMFWANAAIARQS